MHRVMEERSQRTEHEQFLREMHRRETEIRERISRTRIEREAREIGKGWRKWQEAIPGTWCACLNYKVIWMST